LQPVCKSPTGIRAIMLSLWQRAFGLRLENQRHRRIQIYGAARRQITGKRGDTHKKETIPANVRGPVGLTS
jgi:hypothetical protein